ncbi:hypothetical protein [Luteimicrobium subarcticum]|uniref:Uncharacterized protein n=1 Tax=Luteimicrobium subarcticum TaxID=620910 RepID=A0A2M8W708_9MICO|nr:hypothetical protein [Luteimicrobium subarcticum]PJI86713.1 hypothetical protein CLV34_2633 [Luteimicrobium subarcticum]
MPQSGPENLDAEVPDSAALRAVLASRARSAEEDGAWMLDGVARRVRRRRTARAVTTGMSACVLVGAVVAGVSSASSWRSPVVPPATQTATPTSSPTAAVTPAPSATSTERPTSTSAPTRTSSDPTTTRATAKATWDGSCGTKPEAYLLDHASTDWGLRVTGPVHRAPSGTTELPVSVTDVSEGGGSHVVSSPALVWIQDGTVVSESAGVDAPPDTFELSPGGTYPSAARFSAPSACGSLPGAERLLPAGTYQVRAEVLAGPTATSQATVVSDAVTVRIADDGTVVSDVSTAGEPAWLAGSGLTCGMSWDDAVHVHTADPRILATTVDAGDLLARTSGARVQVAVHLGHGVSAADVRSVGIAWVENGRVVSWGRQPTSVHSTARASTVTVTGRLTEADSCRLPTLAGVSAEDDGRQPGLGYEKLYDTSGYRVAPYLEVARDGGGTLWVAGSSVTVSERFVGDTDMVLLAGG